MQFRNDIQALRGIAVLLVVFYHADLFPLVGGYLGVDIFFVISGFLITGQIHHNILDGQFSFRDFYLRRAWRLLPAAYLVFGLCIGAAPWLLSQAELLEFREQLLGAVSFTANIVLWTQTGYFEEAAELKPLLHTWSLSIEEQYYIIIPVLLSWIPLRRHLLAVALMTLGSLAFLAYFSSDAPNASFYLTPARVWELGIGSLLALSGKHINFCKPALSSLALLLIVTICCVQLLPSWPIAEVNNLVIVLATAILIISPIQILRKGKVAGLLVWFGGISYSLYLVHWPVFAFLNTTDLSHHVSIVQRVSALIFSVFLAILLNRYVEQKFRITEPKHNRRFTPLVLCSLLLIGTGYWLPSSQIQQSDQNLDGLFDKNWGLSSECSVEGSLNNPVCRTHEEPEMLIWGDSFAMHLVPGLKENGSAKFLQATRSECTPIDSVGHYKPLRPKKSSISAGQACAEFNRKTLLFALTNTNIHTVVLASPWNHILTPKSIVIFESSGFEERPSNSQEFKEHFDETLNKLKEAGKKIVVISPPPKGDFNIAKCYARRPKAPDSCKIDRRIHRQWSENIELFMRELETRGIPVYRFQNNLCDELTCRTLIDDEILYRDTVHFSVKGSALYGQKFNLYETLMNMAN